MSVAIITGASSGLGREYIRAVAERCPEIDEFWLIARREEKLQEAAAKFPDRKFLCIPMDLGNAETFADLADLLRGHAPDVKLLINNAGFGKLADFDTAELSGQLGMVDLNCRAMTAVARLTLPYMKSGALIINTCSIASFVPTPRMTVYCSTKAYVMSFSRALRHELRSRNINVLAVCPAPMSTEFLAVAGIGDGNSHAFDLLPRVKPEIVAYKSLIAGLHGRAVYTNRFIYKLYRVLAKLLPHNWLLGLTTV